MHGLTRLVVAALLLTCATARAQQPETLRDKLASGGEGPELVRVAAGNFIMGGGDGDSWLRGLELPRHAVTIHKAFAIGRYEVTRGEFRKFATATGLAAPDWGCGHLRNFFKYNSGNWLNPGFEQTEEHPVVCIYRDNALAFLAWLSKETGQRYRLPTEAEWEFAARASGTSKYVGGDVLEDICQYGNVWDRDGDKEVNPPEKYCSDGFAYTAPVGKYRPNGLGLYDLTGNAAEMVEDCFFENYTGAPADGSAWRKANCDDFTERGGSWSTSGEYLRLAHRTTFGPEEMDSRTGFRVVREID